MGKVLIVAEKPSVGSDIARVLGCSKKCKGYILGNDYVVTWAVGHLIKLCDPKDYDTSFRKWSFETLPIIPPEVQIKVNENTADQYHIVSALMNDNHINSIVCATDAAREGELIFRLIYTMCGCKKPFKRLWISSMTDESILNGMENLKSSTEYDHLYQSALSRAFADWIVGINATRAYSVKYKGAKLSMGRVQTPTLALIVNRQKEIEAFKSKDYWTVKAFYHDFSGQWFDKETKETKLFSEKEAKSIADKVKNKAGAVADIKSQKVNEPPPLLYNLDELQKDANTKYGFTAQETLDIAQTLYDNKHITYPRTDSRYLSDDLFLTVEERLLKLSKHQDYSGLITAIFGNFDPGLASKRMVNNAKITDHHAIIPDTVIPLNLDEDESKVYDLIVKRFLSSFYPDYIYTITTVIVEVEDENFSSKNKTVNQLGWMECYQDAEKDPIQSDNALPPLEVGDPIDVLNSKVSKHATRPPSQYTDATLIAAMGNAGRFVDDKEVKQYLKGCGLGTSATRAATIEKLIDNKYMQRRKGFLQPTQKGIELIEIVDEELKSPEMTGKWEQALYAVEEGKMTSGVFLDCITHFIQDLITRVEYSPKRTDLQIANIEENAYPYYKKRR